MLYLEYGLVTVNEVDERTVCCPAQWTDTYQPTAL